MRRRLLRTLALFVSFGALSACGSETPQDTYWDFIDRADRSPPPVEEPEGAGVLLDPTGRYLFNIDLGGTGLGDVLLPLTVTFEDFAYTDATETEATVSGAFGFPEDAPDAAPLASFEDVTIDRFGRMALDVGFVRLEPERSPIEDTAVETQFVLQTTIIDLTSMCGLVNDDESNVSQPIPIPLRGVTFGALRYGDQGQQPVDVPTRCPAEIGTPTTDAGMDVGSDAGMSDAGGGDTGGDTLEPPDVELEGGQRANITGTYWMSVGVAGGALALDFLAEVQYYEGDAFASIDGTLRLPDRERGEAAVATFSEPVDENGEFTVIVRNLRAQSSLGEVAADVALRGIILDEDTWCGVAGGEVFDPIPVFLDGTTFGAVRLPDDFPAPPIETGPENAINACP